MSLIHSSDFASSSMLCSFCIGFGARLPIHLALTVSRVMRGGSSGGWDSWMERCINVINNPYGPSLLFEGDKRGYFEGDKQG